MPTRFEGPLRGRYRAGIPFVAALMLLGGCATTTTNVQQIDRLESVGADPRIVLMPPDIRYYLLTASGLPEPNAEWTTAARENFSTALLDYADSIGADVKALREDNLGASEIAYESLHGVVGATLLQHHFGMSKLPSKAGNFDWSLGPGVNEIARNHNADYALFVHYRDYQASGGRIAFAILAAAAGVGVATGAEGGFASLVDLQNGDIVWFNVVNAGAGELRDPDKAAIAVNNLFRDMPTAKGGSAAQ